MIWKWCAYDSFSFSLFRHLSYWWLHSLVRPNSRRIAQDISIKCNYVHLSNRFPSAFFRDENFFMSRDDAAVLRGRQGIKWFTFIETVCAVFVCAGLTQTIYKAYKSRNIHFREHSLGMSTAQIVSSLWPPSPPPTTMTTRAKEQGRKGRKERENESEKVASKWKWSFPEGLLIKIACKQSQSSGEEKSTGPTERQSQ